MQSLQKYEDQGCQISHAKAWGFKLESTFHPTTSPEIAYRVTSADDSAVRAALLGILPPELKKYAPAIRGTHQNPYCLLSEEELSFLRVRKLVSRATDFNTLPNPSRYSAIDMILHPGE